MPMTRNEFLIEMDGILELPTGTLRGEENLDELETWDSTALIMLISLAQSNNGVHISPDQIVNCTTVADLLGLAAVEGSSS